ncbi:hypothetical protein [Streptomyces sp. NPDC050560]|uniref:hypothetical protein n=1 Tax=Streptomyces sp. NPDC050560 TaxID=3365630 RepID=UPI0037922208
MTSDRLRRAVLRWPVPAVLALAAVVGCSGGDGAPKDDPGLSAGQVCDGLFDEEAGGALRRLADDDRFGDTDKDFSVDKAVRPDDLGRFGTGHSTCLVYPESSEEFAPLVQIDFSLVNGAFAIGDGVQDTVSYPIGDRAATTGLNMARIYFKCPVKDGEKTSPYIAAHLRASARQLRGEHLSGDRMAVLNSAARRVARRLDCLDTANLPTTVPAPSREQ